MDPSSIFSDDDGDDNFDQFLSSVKEKDAASKPSREKDFLVDDDEEEFEPDSTQDPDDSFDLDDTLPKKKRKTKEKLPPQQCHGPSCVQQARKRSKYCSGKNLFSILFILTPSQTPVASQWLQRESTSIWFPSSTR